MDREILGLILARGGSKGIPGKNIKDLAGKPLIAYTIEAAKKSKYIDRVVVSTDDEEIARVSREYGAEIPFMRPAEYARDNTTSNETILHALNWFEKNENYRPEYFTLLQPTSPFRSQTDIDNSFERLFDKEASFLVSLCETTENPYWMKTINNNGMINSFIDNKKIRRRQDLPELYILNGAIYIAKREEYLKKEDFINEDTLGYIMSKENSIDIDEPMDLKFARFMMEETKNESK